MTDSPRIEEVFAGVIAEHTGYSLMSPHCFCGARLDKPKGNPQSAWHAHVAERLAARFKQVAYADIGTWRLRSQRLHADDVLLFRIIPRLVGGDQ